MVIVSLANLELDSFLIDKLLFSPSLILKIIVPFCSREIIDLRVETTSFIFGRSFGSYFQHSTHVNK